LLNTLVARKKKIMPWNAAVSDSDKRFRTLDLIFLIAWWFDRRVKHVLFRLCREHEMLLKQDARGPLISGSSSCDSCYGCMRRIPLRWSKHLQRTWGK
jgi:hypothetical protein